MPKLPVVSPKKLIRVLENIGFVNRRSRGSHVMMVNPDGRRTIVPMHGRDIPNGTLLAILRDISLAKEDLIKLL